MPSPGGPTSAHAVPVAPSGHCGPLIPLDTGTAILFAMLCNSLVIPRDVRLGLPGQIVDA